MCAPAPAVCSPSNQQHIPLPVRMALRLTDDGSWWRLSTLPAGHDMPAYDNELALIVAELNRAAPGSRTTAPEIPQGTATLDQLLAHAARRGASDLLLI